MQQRKYLDLAAMVLGLIVMPAVAQTPPARPSDAQEKDSLLFREDWKQPPYTGALNDETRRATPDALTNPKLELKLYGTDAHNVGVYNHEKRFDLWSGVVASPVAIALRDKTNYADLSGPSRLRATVRTMGLHVLYPIVKLADGTYLTGSRGVNTDGDFLQIEIAFDNMRWFKLNPQKVVTGVEVKNPDLSKVDEIGFVDLAPGGGHGVSGAFNLSTFEVFAKGVPR